MDVTDLMKLPPEQQLLITTGSQGEPFAALSLMAAKRHKWVDIDPEDTILISATPIPGNEKSVSRVISKLNRTGSPGVSRHGTPMCTFRATPPRTS